MASEIELNSSDHFQLLFDYKIKKEKGTANTSQLLIELASQISSEELSHYLLANPHFKALTSTRVIRPFFGKERYRFDVEEELDYSEVKVDFLDLSEVFQNDDVGTGPVKITLFQLPKSSSILFQFNHVYIDNNGVKNLLRSFNGEQFDFIRKIKPDKVSFFKRMKITFQLSRKMMSKWYESKAFIHSSTKEPIHKGFKFLTFTDEETDFIKAKIKRSHHIESVSSLMLAACCLSLKQLLLKRGEELKEFAFQQPFDLAPRKEVPYILGNRFSFIHYRLQPEQVSTLAEVQNEVNKQTLQQMKDNIPQNFLHLESVLRLVNLRFHLWMISLPARGKMTSFAYSFVDETKVIDQFAGRKILNMIHMPPVMRKPPVTIGFAYYDSRLLTQLCYDKNSVCEDEADLLFDSIKDVLLAQE